jgi:4-amino-4-deoxy-L-arabinose transferase-like glycosyltransferase
MREWLRDTLKGIQKDNEYAFMNRKTDLIADRVSPVRALLKAAGRWKSCRPAVFVTLTVLFAFVLRMIVVTAVTRNISGLSSDGFGWESWEMGWTARSIFLGRGFSSPFLPVTGPTALVPPLYPYLVAGVFKLLGLNTLNSAIAILSFNSLCSSVTCIPLYFLARRSLSERVARGAAIFWAVYPFSIYFAADRVWDYTVTALLFTCCLLVAQRLHLRGRAAWAGFGVLYGVAAMSNPAVVSLFPFLLLIALYKVRRVNGGWIAKGLLAVLAFAAVCAPWTIRNERVMHARFFVRDGFWEEFYAGNNGDTSESNSSWTHPASNSAEMKKYQSMGEIAYLARKHDLGVRFLKNHPGFVAVASVRRMVRFWTGYWSFRPHYLKNEPMDLPNVFFCLGLLYLLGRGIRRWWNEDKGAALPYLVAVVVFPLPYYLTHSSTDYRQPLEPVLVMLMAVGLFGGSRRETPSRETERELEPSLVEAQV